MGTHAFVVLVVGLFLGIAGIEAGDAVEVVAAVFAQLVAEGEAEVPPGGVVARDVHAGGFDALGDDFDVVFGGVALVLRLRGMLGSGLVLGLGPFFGIECLFHYLGAYLGLR